eukprot:CAMPEP_0182442732 /NCGR_PEP_ID=MMETSP1172-20130603/1629_1 /TAXON_ID=708627 /ORGANISM="Timspurckia oligopyrenoides, Strain CCMP3278" /LENGTH=445 /DNA_ID=CAMNT_0024637749 /DNA_START=238 /DNA_END=1572 /DNA_ORIENTATION=+
MHSPQVLSDIAVETEHQILLAPVLNPLSKNKLSAGAQNAVLNEDLEDDEILVPAGGDQRDAEPDDENGENEEEEEGDGDEEEVVDADENKEIHPEPEIGQVNEAQENEKKEEQVIVGGDEGVVQGEEKEDGKVEEVVGGEEQNEIVGEGAAGIDGERVVEQVQDQIEAQMEPESVNSVHAKKPEDQGEEKGEGVELPKSENEVHPDTKSDVEQGEQIAVGMEGDVFVEVEAVIETYRIIVLTYNRASSLKRLLESLQDADYGEVAVLMQIFIDRNADGSPHDEHTLKVANEFGWKHGSKEVIAREEHVGLFGQWISSWDGEEHEHAMIFEDDLQVSPIWFKWWLHAMEAYGDRDNVAGYTLQRANVRANQTLTNKPIHMDPQHSVFMYKLLGSWGFSPRGVVWREFRAWYNEKSMDPSYIPYVESLKMNEWFKKQIGKGTMWTMW